MATITPAAERFDELRRILEDRRAEVLGDLRHRLRDVGPNGAFGDRQDVRDEAEASETDLQEDIEVALMQIQSETVHKIDEALTRLRAGTYGDCEECGEPIAARRLRALPFASRCKACEDSREAEDLRVAARRRPTGFLRDVA